MSTHIEKELPVRDAPSRAASAPQLSEKVRSLRISHTPEQHGSGAKLPWILCLLLAGATAYLGWKVQHPTAQATSENRSESGPAAASSSDSPKPSQAPAVADSGGVVLESKGYIIPTHQILLSPKVNGMVKYLRVRKPELPSGEGIPLIEGLRVEKGDVLAELESTDYEADVTRAKAALLSSEQKLEMERKNVPNEIDRAQAELNEAMTNRDYLQTVHDRNQKLSKTAAISPNELQKSGSDYDQAVHRVQRLERALQLISGPRAERIQVAEADVKVARADLIKAEWRLGNCLIVAPITGTILKKNVEEGNIVNPVAFNGSYSVCDMADLSDLEVDLSIQERDVSRVFQGQRCVVRSEAYPERAYQGYVSRLMPIADRAKGAIPVRVKISIPQEEEGVYLKPEMGAVVSFTGKDPAGKAHTQSPPSQNDAPQSQAP